ncbi:MAG: hypothetical protein FWE20_10410 [Defluviitaleaceae bacterium]|nr:hypothetical protein [Defluviitaleaceae bacterium]
MSWAQIRSAINSNLSRTLDAQFNDRFNQLDSRINTLESRITTASNSITTVSGVSDRVLERVSDWRAAASNNVRERVAINRNISLQGPQTQPSQQFPVTVLTIQGFVPGTYRLQVSFTPITGNNPNMAVNISVRLAGSDRTLNVNQALGIRQNFSFDITVLRAVPPALIPVSQELTFQQTSQSLPVVVSVHECTIGYDFVEAFPRSAPLLTQ